MDFLFSDPNVKVVVEPDVRNEKFMYWIKGGIQIPETDSAAS